MGGVTQPGGFRVSSQALELEKEASPELGHLQQGCSGERAYPQPHTQMGAAVCTWRGTSEAPFNQNSFHQNPLWRFPWQSSG